MVPVKIVIDRQIVAKISFGVPDILEMPGWEQVYEEPLLSKFLAFFVVTYFVRRIQQPILKKRIQTTKADLIRAGLL